MRKNECALAFSGDGGDKLWLAAQAATGGAIWTFAVYWAGVLMPERSSSVSLHLALGTAYCVIFSSESGT